MWENFFHYYQWQLSLTALVIILAIPYAARYLLRLLPALREVQRLNTEASAQRRQRDYYVATQTRAMSWGIATQLAIFAVLLPFCLTDQPQPAWQMLLDLVVILMVYDLFYYLTHRFLFHDGALGGPLRWVHAVHHQQKNPCREDSSYLHPIEICIGLLLYAGTIGVLALLMGRFHWLTIVITWITFQEINRHNHNLMAESRFPYRYLKYLSYMHHVHHARFTAGNFGTISLFYDWLFGTYDTGAGYQRPVAEKVEEVEKAGSR